MYRTHNGMNLSKSIHNPTSRFRRVMDYLNTNGPRTKRQILSDVFGKTVGVPYGKYVEGKWVSLTPNTVTMGWASYVFNLAVKYGYVRKIRRDRTTYWTTAHLIHLITEDS